MADNLENLSVGELRQLAVAKGWSTATRSNKAGLLKMLREHPDGPPATQAPAEKPAAKKAKPEFAPKVTDKGRLDHSECGHPRNLAGRSACRAAYREANKDAK